MTLAPYMVFYQTEEKTTVQIVSIACTQNKENTISMSTYRSTFPTMCYKIVNRNFYHASFLQSLQRSLEKLEIERIRVIEVVLIARGHLMLLLV